MIYWHNYSLFILGLKSHRQQSISNHSRCQSYHEKADFPLGQLVSVY